MKKGQIWVETVIYTLIGLAIIAVILVTVLPRIEKIRDKMVIEQTISAMNDFNSKLLELEQTSSGNVRVADFKISKGKIEIDSINDRIIYVLEDTKLEMSEPGVEIIQESVAVKTEKTGAKFKITLTTKYENIDLTYGGVEENKVLHAGTGVYKITLENTGVISEGKKNINLEVV